MEGEGGMRIRGERTRDIAVSDGITDWRPGDKECRQPLEPGKGRTQIPWEPPEGSGHANAFILAL